MQTHPKRIAKSFNLHRYLPQAKVYELSITWLTD
jgi:hypothetical protein